MNVAAVIPLQRNRQTVMACQGNLAFMSPLPKNSMRLIVTSPPYNIGKAYEKRSPLDAYVQQQVYEWNQPRSLIMTSFGSKGQSSDGAMHALY